MLKLVLHGNPTPQARLRFFKRGRKVMMYDPQGSLKYHLKHLVTEQVDMSQ